jgi:signal peptidase II
MIRRLTVQLVLVGAIVATIGCDRVTKHVATTSLAGEPGRSYLADTIRLEYVENQGGFLSVGADLPRAARTALFMFGSGLGLLVLVGLAVRFQWRGALLVGAGLIFAGGASNWIDRVMRGSVVDFIQVGVGPLRTGIFNVADVAVMVGAAVLLLAERRRS